MAEEEDEVVGSQIAEHAVLGAFHRALETYGLATPLVQESENIRSQFGNVLGLKLADAGVEAESGRLEGMNESWDLVQVRNELLGFRGCHPRVVTQLK